MTNLETSRLRDFIVEFATLIDKRVVDHEIQRDGAALLRDLVANDDWLPPAFAQADPDRYLQYLLYCDPRARFSVSSFVWGPDQATPIHNHNVWGLVGVLRGAERVEGYRCDATGRLVSRGPASVIKPGDVDVFGPADRDIHRVANAYQDRVSISIHVYGADIGAVERSIYDLDGRSRPFVSSYANDVLPNLWGRPA